MILIFFLGLNVTQTKDIIHLYQHKYIQDMLKNNGLETSKVGKTPMKYSGILLKHNGIPLANGALYRTIIGALQYYILTRPEIAF